MKIASIEIKGSPETLSKHLGSICYNMGFPICIDSLAKEKRLMGLVYGKINDEKSECKIMYEEESNEELLAN